MASKCKEKYGREWSNQLTKITSDFFSSNEVGAVKHIDKKGYGMALTNLDLKPELKLYIAKDKTEDKVFIFSHKNWDFVESYKSVQDMVDDGWAID